MLVNHNNEGEAIMGTAFVKLLQEKLPNQEAILPKAREVAVWIRDHVMTDKEKLAVRDAGLLETIPF